MTENQNQNQMGFTEQEADAIRRGVMAATALVSQAEPGFFDSFREAMAGSKAMAEAPEELRRVMQGGLIAPPKAESKEDLHNKMLQQAQEALRIGDAKGPQVGQSVRALMQDVTTKVAQAADNISPNEQNVIDQIMSQAGSAQQEQGAQGQFNQPAQGQFEQQGTQQQFEQPQFGQPTDPNQR